MYHWIEYNMCDHERLPEELWGTRKETSEYVQHFFWKFKTCTVPRTKRRQTPYKPPFFSIDWRKIENAKFAQVWAINDKYDLYSWRQGVRTYTTAEPTHEPHPHFGSINGEHIEIVPVNMNTFLRPLLLRRSEFWRRTDRSVYSRSMHKNNDLCGDKTLSYERRTVTQRRRRQKIRQGQIAYSRPHLKKENLAYETCEDVRHGDSFSTWEHWVENVKTKWLIPFCCGCTQLKCKRSREPNQLKQPRNIIALMHRATLLRFQLRFVNLQKGFIIFQVASSSNVSEVESRTSSNYLQTLSPGCNGRKKYTW